MPVVPINGTDIYYELTGEGDETVLLLNGISMSVASWGWQVQALLAAGYRVLCMDFRGQLRSGQPEATAYTMPQHASDVVALLDLLNIARTHIVAISYGGAVAQHLALDHASRVGKLVLADTLAWSDEVNTAIADTWLAAAHINQPALRFDLGLPLTFGARYLRDNAAMIAKLREWSIQQPWPPLERLVRGMLQHDVRARLGEVHIETLVIVGANDRFTPLYHSRVLADGIASAKLAVIEDCGHASCLEQPDMFNRLVIEFLTTRQT